MVPFGACWNHYEISQWYPKIVVYDTLKPIDLDTVENIKGKSGYWHPDGYHRVGEFYGEYGRFDVEITVPAGYKVAATGEVVEPFIYKNFLRGRIVPSNWKGINGLTISSQTMSMILYGLQIKDSGFPMENIRIQRYLYSTSPRIVHFGKGW